MRSASNIEQLRHDDNYQVLARNTNAYFLETFINKADTEILFEITH